MSNASSISKLPHVSGCLCSWCGPLGAQWFSRQHAQIVGSNLFDKTADQKFDGLFTPVADRHGWQGFHHHIKNMSRCPVASSLDTWLRACNTTSTDSSGTGRSKLTCVPPCAQHSWILCSCSAVRFSRVSVCHIIFLWSVLIL